MKLGTVSISLRIYTSVTEQIRKFNVPRNTGITSDMFSRRYFPEKCGLGPFLASLSALAVSSLLCILELSRLTRVGGSQKHNYNCNTRIQGVSVYTNLSQLHVSASSN